MARRSQRRVVGLLLTLVAFVLTHQLVFLYTYGSGADAALVRTGHGGVWAGTVLLVLLCAAGLLITAAADLARLSRRARRIEHALGDGAVASASEQDSIPALTRTILGTWIAIGFAVGVLLVISENVEHALVRAPLPGLAVFQGSEYAGTIPILAAISLAVAIVRALYQWRRSLLLARLTERRAKLPRATHSPRRPAPGSVQRGRLIGRRLAVRAPPLAAIG